MDQPTLQAVLAHVHRIASNREPEGLSDRELLEHFSQYREERAFAELVRRHGPMVREVCERIVRQVWDADDAFQATFLVLAQKARSIRKPASVGSWLYGVATRVAWKARARADKARRCYCQEKTVPDPAREAAWRELLATLDAEVVRLPARFRGPVVLCYLEGQTQDEAARQLGWSLRTLKRRLEQARELLRLRLQRRGLALSAALLTAGLVLNPARAVSPTLAASTLRAVMLLAHEARLAGLVSIQVAALVKGTNPGLAPVPLVLAWVAALGVAISGAGWLFARMHGARPSADALEGAGASASNTPNGIVIQPQPMGVVEDGDPLPAGALRRLGSLQFRQGGEFEALLPLPDGKTLLTSASWGDPAVNVWDLVTGRVNYRLPGNHAAKQVALSKDGRLLAVPQGGSIQLWDPGSGKTRGQIPTPGREVLSVAFFPDGKLIASAGIDQTIRFHDVTTKRELSPIRVELKRVNYLALLPNGKSLVAADETDLSACLIDARTGRPQQQLERHGTHYGFALSPDGRTLAAGGQDGSVVLWDTATGHRLRSLAAGQKFVTAVAFSPDGNTLAWSESGPLGANSPIRLWDLGKDEEVRRMPGHGYWTERLAFSADGQVLYAGIRDGFLGQWDVATGKEIPSPGTNRFRVSKVFLSPDGATLAAQALDRVHFWETATGRELESFAMPDRRTGALAFSPDWRMLAAGSRKNTVLLWDVASRRLITRLAPKPNPLPPDPKPSPMPTNPECMLRDPDSQEMVGAIAFSPDGKQLVAGGWDSTVRIWDCETGAEVRQFTWKKNPITDVAFAAEGKAVVALSSVRTGSGKQIRFWDTGTGHLLPQLSAMEYPVVLEWSPALPVFSPDGRLAVQLRPEGRIPLWEVTTGKILFNLRGHEGPVLAAAFAPDGRTLASAGRDNTIRLWELPSAKEIGKFTGHRGKANTLAFTPDGKVLVSGGDDSTILLWDVSHR
jgi:RNA polymerase sigma factor (sigma-70 family)